MITRNLFTRELETDASKGLLVFIGVLITCSAAASGAVAGFEYRDFLQRELEKNKPLPVRKSAENPPKPLLGCDQASREEYSRTCRARWRSAQIGGDK